MQSCCCNESVTAQAACESLQSRSSGPPFGRRAKGCMHGTANAGRSDTPAHAMQAIAAPCLLHRVRNRFGPDWPTLAELVRGAPGRQTEGRERCRHRVLNSLTALATATAGPRPSAASSGTTMSTRPSTTRNGRSAHFRGLGSALPHLHRDCARPSHICTGLAPLRPNRHRAWAHRCHVCTGTGLPLPHLHSSPPYTPSHCGRFAQRAFSVPARPFRSHEHAPLWAVHLDRSKPPAPKDTGAVRWERRPASLSSSHPAR